MLSLSPGSLYNTVHYCLSTPVSNKDLNQFTSFQIGGVLSSISLPIEGVTPVRIFLISMQLFLLTYLVCQLLASLLIR